MAIENPFVSPRKAYNEPILRVYGDIRVVTQTTGSKLKNADGGKGVANKTG